jgi:excisionase family DNA binding protein
MESIKVITITADELHQLITEAVCAAISKQNESPKEVKMISRKEAAKMLGCSLPTLLSLVKSGKLPVVRIRRKVIFKEADVRSVKQGGK